MQLTTITAAAAVIFGLGPAVFAAPTQEPGMSKRQDPYNINWSFLSAKSGDPFVQKSIHADGIWHRITGQSDTQVYAGALREGGADGDLARCFFDDLSIEVFHQQYKYLNEVRESSPSGLIGYQVCCFYERKSNGIEPDPPRCCHSSECGFMEFRD